MRSNRRCCKNGILKSEKTFVSRKVFLFSVCTKNNLIKKVVQYIFSNKKSSVERLQKLQVALNEPEDNIKKR